MDGAAEDSHAFTDAAGVEGWHGVAHETDAVTYDWWITTVAICAVFQKTI